jgi:hypothetical protein
MLKRIPTPEEYELEKAYKALRLNAGSVYFTPPTKLVAASYSTSSSAQQKPTVRIKRLYPELAIGSGNKKIIKLKGASSIRKEIEKAEKVLRLNGG